MSGFQLTAEIIEQRLKVLTPSANLIYDVLTAYDVPRNLITRLRSGDLNKAKISHSILWKNKLFYTEVMPGMLVDTFATVQQEQSILKLKPRFIIVSDGKRWAAFDIKTKHTRSFPIAELYKHHDFFLPWARIEQATVILDSPADIRAAQRMGKLFDALRRDNPTIAPHDLNVFLARLLFCLFAEDSGIFENKNIFTDLVTRVSREDGSDLKSILGRLFKIMNTPMNSPSRRTLPEIYKRFPYVNGGLFARETEVPAFSPKSRAAVLEAGALNWGEINTDIFGNMFQACLDQDKRQSLGEHYTSVPNIMKVLHPLFLEELQEAAEKAKGDVRAVNALIKRMTNMRFFDPACGSGNFLLIAYKELRRIEMALLESVQHEKGISIFPNISISQFYGIEIDDFAHEIATLSMWLVEHQMNKVFQETFDKYIPALPLKKNENIVLGNALRLDWGSVCPKEDTNAAPLYTVNELWANSHPEAFQKKIYDVYVFGNPPYAGKQAQSNEQKEDLAKVFEGWKKTGCLDYILCWFRLGVKYIQGSNAKCAFVATNSITQGEQVSAFWPRILKDGVEISFAYSSFRWSNNAKYNAGVTCVIIGIESGNCINKKKIYSETQARSVQNISPYLREDDNTIIGSKERQISALPDIAFGTMPNDGGSLILDSQECSKLLNACPEARKYIKWLVGSAELLRGQKRYCLWLQDISEQDMAAMGEIRERVKRCRDYRLSSKRATTRKLAATPHLMGEIRYKPTDAIIVPSVSSERRAYIPMGYVDSGTVISNAAFAIYDAEPWVFAIVSSAMHMAWMRTTCGRLKTDYRYSAKLCYNTFPIRKLKPAEKEMLNEAAFAVLDIRQKHTEMTLGDMYQPDLMPEDLKQAHHHMDTLVDSIYRKQPFNTDEERLQSLFALYKEMTR